MLETWLMFLKRKLTQINVNNFVNNSRFYVNNSDYSMLIMW